MTLPDSHRVRSRVRTHGQAESTSAALAVTVIDDDSAMLVLSTTTVEVMEGDATGVTYTVRLATQPSATTTVAISGQGNTDVSVDEGHPDVHRGQLEHPAGG